MKKPRIGILVAVCGLLAIAQIGSNPRFIEELAVGGGTADTVDSGADFDKTGNIEARSFLPGNLVLWVPMNDNTGTAPVDASLQSHVSAITAGAGAWSDDSPFRHSYDFDGADTKIDAGSGATLDDVTTLTFAAWVKADGLGELSAGMIASKNRWRLYIQATEEIAFFADRTSTNGVWSSGSNALTHDTWHFVVVTYDNTSVSNDPVFYVDGQSITVNEDTTPVGTATSDASNSLILGNLTGQNQTWDGHLANVMVFDRILAAEEVQRLYVAASESPTFQDVTAIGQILGSASTTARASLNLPEGAAPSSPADGDVWTTTAGLFIHVNSTTYGPLGAASAFDTEAELETALTDVTDVYTDNDTVPVADGGTGAATLTDGGILLGSGTGAITALGAATNGQIPIGDGTTDPVLATLTGTANEITVTNGAGTITIDIPNDPQFDNGLTLLDDVAATFGTGGDFKMLYESAGDELRITDGSNNLWSLNDEGAYGQVLLGTATDAGTGGISPNVPLAISHGTSPTIAISESNDGDNYAYIQDRSDGNFAIVKTRAAGSVNLILDAISEDNSTQTIKLGGNTGTTGNTTVVLGESGGANQLTLSLFGDTGTNGPQFRLFNADDEDTTINYYKLMPNDSELYLGTDLDADIFAFGSNGTLTLGTGPLIKAQVTIAADVTEPDVSGGNTFTTSAANTSPTPISDLGNPTVGQYVTLIGGGGTYPSSIADSGNFNLNVAWSAAVDDVLILYVQADDDYIEVGRVDN